MVGERQEGEDRPLSKLAIRRALVSVHDKTGLGELSRGLHEAGVEIVSTGSTAARIAAAGVPVTRVEQLTGFPECLDGRVKTLHPRVHAGLLADTTRAEHRAPLEERRRLAARAFAHTAAYDTAVAAWFAGTYAPDETARATGWPLVTGAQWQRYDVLRYGENPHQQAALYVSASGSGVARAEQLHGKQMSYNNYVDT